MPRRPTLPPDRPARLLIVRLSAIGDCLHALPVVAELRRQLPEAAISWAIEGGAHRLLEGHPAVDRFHVVPRLDRREGRPLGERLAAHRRFRRELREAAYDVAIDLQGLTKSAAVAWWSRAPLRLGFAGREGRELSWLFLNRRLPAPPGARHVIEKNLSLLRGLDLSPPGPARFPMPELAPSPELAAFLAHTTGSGPYAVVCPGTTWPTKIWPAEEFAEVAAGLADRLPVIVAWGTTAEHEAAQRIAAAAGERATVAPATDLRQLGALLGGAALVVGNDSGPVHLAAALGTPCVAVFGATDPARNGPWGDRHRVLAADGLDCRPCGSRRCARGDLACLERVSPEAVLDACEELLAALGVGTSR